MKAEVGMCYRHYKGNEYSIEEIAIHSETKEELVIYKKLLVIHKELKVGSSQCWARPRKMFEETISVDGKEIHRFEKI